MLIDWFTVIAQAVNFLILVWLLKRFLYKPILQAIAEREKVIAGQIRNAELLKAEAKEEREKFQHKNEEIERETGVIMSKAKDEAKAERQRLLNEVRKEADSLRSRFEENLRNEQENLSSEITHKIQQEVFAIARKALADLASMNLEDQITEVFIRRLHELNDEEKESMAAVLKSFSSINIVRSTLDLSSVQQAKIENAIEEIFHTKIKVRFEIAADQISGIELILNGYKVTWSIADYLASMEKGVISGLKEKSRFELKSH